MSDVSNEPRGAGSNLEGARDAIASSERELVAIEQALGALAAGTFGRCEICGEPIEQSVLEQDLDARRCGEHRV